MTARSILLVDDDVNLLAVLKNLFIHDDYDVATCPDGLEAIQKCREEHPECAASKKRRAPPFSPTT